MPERCAKCIHAPWLATKAGSWCSIRCMLPYNVLCAQETPHITLSSNDLFLCEKDRVAHPCFFWTREGKLCLAYVQAHTPRRATAQKDLKSKRADISGASLESGSSRRSEQQLPNHLNQLLASTGMKHDQAEQCCTKSNVGLNGLCG